MRSVQKKDGIASDAKQFSFYGIVQAIVPPALLAFLTYLVYFSSFNYPFQFDDIPNISKRFAIRSGDVMHRWWWHSRWFVDWINNFNFTIGRFEPYYYRVINLIIHTIAGLLAFYLIKTLCLQLKKNAFVSRNAAWIAFTSAALFLLHPMQTQTVSYVIQARLEGVASLLVLAALLLYTKGMMAKSIVAKGVYGVLFALTTVASFGTKELVVVIPFLAVLIDWFFLCEGDWKKFVPNLKVYATLGLFFAALIWRYIGTNRILEILSFSAGQMNNLGNILTPDHFDLIMPWSYFITQFRVIVHYMAMFLFPVGLSVEYDWKIAPGFFCAEVIFPFIVLATILGFIAYSISHKKNSMVTFGLLWFFICVAPRSTFIPCAELVCDYKAYLAGLGILFAVAIGIVYAMQWAAQKLSTISFAQRYEMRYALLSVLLVAVGSAAYVRNSVWSDSIGFWLDNAAKAPNKARLFNNLGVALCEANRPAEAVDSFKRAISLDNRYPDPYSNMSVAHSMLENTDEAINDLRKAIELAPLYPEAYNNLGTLLIDRKRYDEAKHILSVAIQLRPYYGKAFYNMARMHEELGDKEKAWEFLKKATDGDFDLPDMFVKLGNLSVNLSKYNEAIKAYTRAIMGGHQSDEVSFNLANAYFMSGHHDAAFKMYHMLAAKDPADGRYSYNKGEAYFMKKDFKNALVSFKEAATAVKPITQGHFRVSHCLEAMNQFDEARSYLNALFGTDLDNDFKHTVHQQLARLDLQQKLSEGKGSMRFKDLTQALSDIDKKA